MSDSDFTYRFLGFSQFDYRSIEDELAKMAEKGWRLDHMGAFLWRFKRTEPARKKFCAVFFREVLDCGSMQGERPELLDELCGKAGWKKENQGKNMQIFCAGEDAAPLDTDEEVRRRDICASVNRFLVPGWILGLFSMIILVFFNGTKSLGNFPDYVGGAGWAFLITLYTAFVFGIQLLGYLFWAELSRKKISEGGTCIRAAWHRRLMGALLLGYPLLLAGYLAEGMGQTGGGILLRMGICAVFVLAAVSSIHFLSRYLREKAARSG